MENSEKRMISLTARIEGGGNMRKAENGSAVREQDSFT